MGHLVRRLSLGARLAGQYATREEAAHWDGRTASGEQAASGIYYYTLHIYPWNQATATKSPLRKMILLK